ncbi:hypothetical protein ABZX92_33670 [Lentzea sp. NPDC006480]|uniref:hypothetical protein n=1 Tax=Lentzea sp. NPDC006480 TaxID=3157176 RepID=UPI0033B3BB34
MVDTAKSSLGGASAVTEKKKVSPAGSRDATMDRQQPLLALVDRVRGDVEARGSGFVEAKIDVEARKVTIFWHGAVSHSLRERILSFRSAGTTVEFVRVPYTLNELQQEARRILEHYPQAVSAGPNATYSGLTVGVNSAHAAAADFKIESRMPVETARRPPSARRAGWLAFLRSTSRSW